ncbi:Beta-1,4-xylosyltransferase IRX9 [Linum grandiflorum]
MGSLERPRKKVQIWKKAVVHFALCFVMGFFSGFAPASKSSTRSLISSNTSYAQPQPQPQIASLHSTSRKINMTRSVPSVPPVSAPLPSSSEEELTGTAEFVPEVKLTSRRLIIIITPTNARDPYQGVQLRRLANTLRLVAAPLLWVVVEQKQSAETNELSEMLRKTGMMYRHLVFKENFTDAEVELEHQRNVALKHVEHHRLSGIVHFAGIHNVYDLDFFDDLREIEMFGTWPMASLSPYKSEVVIEGPVCDSSQVIGWHLKKMNGQTDNDTEIARPPIHVSSFAFNSSILWDPERWGRPSYSEHTSQNSIKFVKEVALEDETKLKGIPPTECSKIMMWRLRLPTKKFVPSPNILSSK